MLTKDFTVESLNKIIRKKDEASYKFIRDLNHRRGYLTYVSERINNDTFEFKNLKSRNINNFLVFRTQKLGDDLILRKLNEALIRGYKIKPTDRTNVVKQTQVLLSDSTPKNVVRLDIKSFYESIDRSILLSKVSKDQNVSFLAIRYLKKIFSLLSTMGISGLPRGLAISSTLSEVYFSIIDSQIRKLAGVYYYDRYVDDIIIFTVGDPEHLKSNISAMLPIGMTLNEKKSKIFSVNCRCKTSCLHKPALCPCDFKCSCPIKSPSHEMDFLGYQLQFNDVLGKNLKSPQNIRLELSTRKINIIKTRLVKAFLSHVNIPNFELLLLRIHFLTSNRRIRRMGSRGRLKTGIYYNYPLLTDLKNFDELDRFLREILHSKSSSLGIKLGASMSLKQKQDLLKLTFNSGYSARRVKKITVGDVAKIKRCWNYGK